MGKETRVIYRQRKLVERVRDANANSMSTILRRFNDCISIQ